MLLGVVGVSSGSPAVLLVFGSSRGLVPSKGVGYAPLFLSPPLKLPNLSRTPEPAGVRTRTISRGLLFPRTLRRQRNSLRPSSAASHSSSGAFKCVLHPSALMFPLYVRPCVIIRDYSVIQVLICRTGACLWSIRRCLSVYCMQALPLLCAKKCFPAPITDGNPSIQKPGSHRTASSQLLAIAGLDLPGEILGDKSHPHNSSLPNQNKDCFLAWLWTLVYP